MLCILTTSSSFQKQKNLSRMGYTFWNMFRKLRDEKQLKSCKISWTWWNETILKCKRLGTHLLDLDYKNLSANPQKIVPVTHRENRQEIKRWICREQMLNQTWGYYKTLSIHKTLYTKTSMWQLWVGQGEASGEQASAPLSAPKAQTHGWASPEVGWWPWVILAPSPLQGEEREANHFSWLGRLGT